MFFNNVNALLGIINFIFSLGESKCTTYFINLWISVATVIKLLLFISNKILFNTGFNGSELDTIIVFSIDYIHIYG